jgi:chorismate dehydratase
LGKGVRFSPPEKGLKVLDDTRELQGLSTRSYLQRPSPFCYNILLAMRKLRVSAISFLNTAPLMWDFARGAAAKQGTILRLPPELARNFEVRYDIPSLCADALGAGKADIGLIPAAAYASIPELVILPDVAIAAKAPVKSILLVSKVQLDQVRTLAADNSSRTSVALARVLFHKWRGDVPAFHSAAPNLSEMLASNDAALLIGDVALRVDRSRYLTWDLAEEWQKLTGKPFVFAFWAARMPALAEADSDLDVAQVFRASRDHGMEAANLAVIAREWSPQTGLSQAAVIEYLTANLNLFLDAENLAGLELFFRYAAECGAIAANPALRFLSSAKCAMNAL